MMATAPHHQELVPMKMAPAIARHPCVPLRLLMEAGQSQAQVPVEILGGTQCARAQNQDQVPAPILLPVAAQSRAQAALLQGLTPIVLLYQVITSFHLAWVSCAFMTASPLSMRYAGVNRIKLASAAVPYQPLQAAGSV